MTIKQTGGIFGRNVSFTDVTTDEVTANKVNISTVGGMGLFSGSLLYAGAGDTTLLFSSGGDAILPRGSAGAARDNAVDLGNATNRWKDIYLAGDVVIRSGQGIDFSATAGTGTSELFSDYEEGVFTPTIIGGTSAGTGTYSQQDGVYTKVGNLVTVSCYLAFTAHTGSGQMKVSGLPFAGVGSSLDFQTGATQAQYINAGTSATQLSASIVTTASNISLYGFVNNAAKVATQVNASASGSQLAITLTYRTS